MNQFSRHLLTGILVLTIAFITGCGQTLRAKVVSGEAGAMEVVHASDPRLNQRGIGNVDLTVRPKSTGGELSALTARRFTNDGGLANVQLDDFGTAATYREWQLQARRRGYQSATGTVKIPAGNKWHVLITMAPGSDASADAADDGP